MVKQLKLIACGVLVLLTAAVTDVAAGLQRKCLAGKIKCMSKKAGSLLKCEQKAERPGKLADPNAGACVEKADDKFTGGNDPSKGCFEKLENKASNDCITFDDTAAAEAKVDQCVAQIVAAIDPPPLTQTKCGAEKKKCVAKKLKSILKCHQKAETPGKPPDSNTGDCIDKAVAKYDGGSDPPKGCFVKLENEVDNDCQPPTGNQGTLEGIVDGSCVGAFVALLTTPTTTTTTTPTTPTTTLPCTTSGAPCGPEDQCTCLRALCPSGPQQDKPLTCRKVINIPTSCTCTETIEGDSCTAPDMCFGGPIMMGACYPPCS